jgi:hypothetical protein
MTAQSSFLANSVVFGGEGQRARVERLLIFFNSTLILGLGDGGSFTCAHPPTTALSWGLREQETTPVT